MHQKIENGEIDLEKLVKEEFRTVETHVSNVQYNNIDMEVNGQEFEFRDVLMNTDLVDEFTDEFINSRIHIEKSKELILSDYNRLEVDKDYTFRGKDVLRISFVIEHNYDG